MRKLIISLAAGFLAIVYKICQLFPTRRRIVCITRKKGAPPVDFTLIRDWCAAHKPEWDVVILAKSTTNPLSYFFEMLRETYYIATSRAVVIERICIVVSLLGDRIAAPVIQIWHAVGNMKKFGYTVVDTPEGHSSEVMELTRMHTGYDAVAISSMDFREQFAAGFNVDPAIIFEAPLPRVDLFRDPVHREQQRRAVQEAYPALADGRSVIVYCPTYRKDVPANQHEAMERLLAAVDFSRYHLVFKPHPLSHLAFDDPRVITIAGTSPDALYAADYVISDYSTVIYEAGLLGVPVYLYAYDWDTYNEKRGFNFDISHEVPTLFTDDAAAIIAAIDEGSFDHDAYARFMARNVTLPAEDTCTAQMCRKVIAFAERSRAKNRHTI